MVRKIIAVAALTLPLSAPLASAQQLATLCLDLDPARTGCETATLSRSSSDPVSADLTITAQNGDVLARAESIVWAGQMGGQDPSLSANAAGSLQLHSENLGAGRYGWEQVNTIAFRDGQYLVIGYDYSVFDRLSGSTMACSWNLRTGTQIVDYTLEKEGTPSDSGRLTSRQALVMPLAKAGETFQDRPTFCAAGDF